jgi:antitoxin (DNA-binding transcriptional repressor) of toxin-antitoxin stability system
MQKLNIRETKTKLSAVLMDVKQKGETFLICRNWKPVAKLTPYKKGDRLAYHPVLSKIKINYDPTEELTETEWGETVSSIRGLPYGLPKKEVNNRRCPY